MNRSRSQYSLGLIFTALFIGGWALHAGTPVPYSNPSSVDLLRRVDRTGNLPVVTGTTAPGYPHEPIRAIDGGLQPWRVTGHGAFQTWRITLPESVTMTNVDIFWRGGFYGTNYTLKGSTTGFGSMSTLASVTGNANPHPNHSFSPTDIRYLELNTTAFSDPTYYILYEMSASSSGPVYQRDGYNMLAEPGKVGAIAANMQRNLVDAPANAVDNNINTFVRGANTADPTDNAWFVAPLLQSTDLMAIGLGMYEDQPWSDVKVYLSSDSTYNYLNVGGADTWPGMTWNLVYDHPSGNFNGTHFSFSPQVAQFVRVEWPANSQANAALNELQLFETYFPEPSTALLLAFGGLILRRYRQHG